MAAKRRRRTVGDVVAIALDENRTMFAWVLESPLMAFFNLVARSDRAPAAEDITTKPVLFRIWVMDSALREWPVIGHVDVPSAERTRRWFAKRDAIARTWTLYDGEREIKAIADDWRNHEPAAVWSASHVVDRLRDAIDGKPNKWLESMRAPFGGS